MSFKRLSIWAFTGFVNLALCSAGLFGADNPVPSSAEHPTAEHPTAEHPTAKHPSAESSALSPSGSSEPSGDQVRVASADTSRDVQLARAAEKKLSEWDRSHEGFRPLVTDRALTGWTVLDGKRDSWASNGDLISCVKGGGGWMRTEEIYGDFVCRFEFRLSAGANSGFAFHCQSEGNPSATGFEMQLLDDSAEKYAHLRPEQSTGSLYYRKAPMRRSPLNPVGQWNQAEVACLGPIVRLKINDVEVNRADLSEVVTTIRPVSADGSERTAVLKPFAGHLALQSHTSRVDFKRIVLRDLSTRLPGGVRYTDLIEGSGDPVTADSVATMHVRGQLTDGTPFTDTFTAEKPVTISVAALVSGWEEGLIGMKTGGRRRLIIPPQQAYGAEGVASVIPPQATLLLDVELLAVSKEASSPPAPAGDQ